MAAGGGGGGGGGSAGGDPSATMSQLRVARQQAARQLALARAHRGRLLAPRGCRTLTCSPSSRRVRAHVSKDLKRARAKAASKGAAQAREWRLTEEMLEIVLICFSLAGGVADAAVVYLTLEAQRHRWAPKTDNELVLIVADAFLGADRAHIASLCDFDNPYDSGALKRGVALVEEWHSQAWALGQNKKGVAVCSASVLDHFEERRAMLPDSLKPPAWGTVAPAVARKRLSRWRKRWGGRIAKLRPQDIMPVDELRSKDSWG